MNLQSLVLSFYQSTVRQLDRWGLPLMLVLGYGTALGIRRMEGLVSLERIEMELLHRAFGLLLVGLMAVLAYDRWQSGRPLRGQLKGLKPRGLVDVAFFSGLLAPSVQKKRPLPIAIALMSF